MTLHTDALAAARAQVVALSTELDATRRELWLARAYAAHPGLSEEAAELITATDEAGVLRQAGMLASLVNGAP